MGTCTAREIQAVERFPSLWGSAWAPAAGAGVWGKQRCLLYLHSSWAPPLKALGCWTWSERTFGGTQCSCLCCPCSACGRAELQFSALCVMYRSDHGTGLALSHSQLLGLQPLVAQQPGGGGHPGGSQSITVDWQVTRNGLDLLTVFFILVFPRISRGRF